MKILHLSKNYFPKRGGIESVTKSIAEDFCRQGYDVTVVCNGDYNKKEVIEGVNVIRCKEFLNVAGQPLSFLYIIKAICLLNKYDVIHVHSPNFIALVIALFAYKKKVIIHWHSDVIGKGLISRILVPVEKLALWKASKIVVTSPNYLSSSKPLIPYKHKCEIIPIGINLEDAKFIKRGSNNKTILCVGRLVEYKGFEYLIKALIFVDPEICLKIIGDGPRLSFLQKLVKEMGLDDRVCFVGHVDDRSLRSMMLSASVFCLPSINRAEAFGVVLLEAMTASLPLITYDIPGSGVSFVNEHGVSGIQCNLKSVSDLAEAINSLHSDDRLYARCNVGSWKRVLDNFDQKKCIYQFKSLYNAFAN